jgi:hypothetical protein
MTQSNVKVDTTKNTLNFTIPRLIFTLRRLIKLLDREGIGCLCPRTGRSREGHGSPRAATPWNHSFEWTSLGRVEVWRGIFRPVSSPRHLKPYVRFSLIRLSDNLLPVAFKVMQPHLPLNRIFQCCFVRTKLQNFYECFVSSASVWLESSFLI